MLMGHGGFGVVWVFSYLVDVQLVERSNRLLSSSSVYFKEAECEVFL